MKIKYSRLAVFACFLLNVGSLFWAPHLYWFGVFRAVCVCISTFCFCVIMDWVTFGNKYKELTTLWKIIYDLEEINWDLIKKLRPTQEDMDQMVKNADAEVEKYSKFLKDK